MSATFVSRLSSGTAAAVTRAGVLRRYSGGAIVFGSANDTFCGIVEGGLVRICSSLSDGRVVTHRHVGVGGLVGLGAAVGTADFAVAQAIGDTQIRQLDMHTVRRLREVDAALCLALAVEVHERLVDMTKESASRIRGGLTRRLALQLLDHLGTTDLRQLPVATATHDLLATELGTSREVITRHLRTLGGMGLVVQQKRGFILIVNVIGLVAFGQDL